jgi:fibronectin type 3 domain-containing protein
LGGEAVITPIDQFPPAPPAGLTAVASAAGLELTWDRNAEPDLAGYRIYRAAPGGAFEKIGETRENPSFSDRKTEAGRNYRYAVSAYDQAGNESARSEPVEAMAP